MAKTKIIREIAQRSGLQFHFNFCPIAHKETNIWSRYFEWDQESLSWITESSDATRAVIRFLKGIGKTFAYKYEW